MTTPMAERETEKKKSAKAKETKLAHAITTRTTGSAPAAKKRNCQNCWSTWPFILPFVVAAAIVNRFGLHLPISPGVA
jgi:hypothetical protein